MGWGAGQEGTRLYFAQHLTVTFWCPVQAPLSASGTDPKGPNSLCPGLGSGPGLIQNSIDNSAHLYVSSGQEATVLGDRGVLALSLSMPWG